MGHRLVDRTSVPPPTWGRLGGGNGGLDALVTAPRTPGRARLTIAQREVEVLDEEGRVRVANRANFVGRRRVLQQCLAALRRDATALGVILYGLGGQGKSTLAHRLRQRWLQRSAQHGAVVLYGRLDESLLLRKLNNGLAGSPAAREALNSRDALRFRLRHALTSCDEQLLIILDNFEDNFEQEGGAPRLVDGRPLLTGAVVQLLDDLLFALQGSADQGQEHRLLITSRYRPVIRFGGQGDGVLAVFQLDRLNAEAVQKKLTRLTPAGRATPATAPLRERATAIADGNPRLLEWLFELLAQETATTPDMDAVLARMAAKETALRENILAAALLAAQSPTLRHLLVRGLTCELPVPAAVFDALEGVDPALPNTTPERERATTLGLLEVTTPSPPHPVTPSPLHLRVPRILAPLLAGEEQPDPTQLAATAARTLYTLWWEADDTNPSEAQQVELHRLALAGGETAIAEEVADELAGHWNRRDQYRYREVIDLVTRTVAQSANARLWNEIGYAKSQLGEKQQAIDHYQAALAVCPADEQALQATILNNLGRVYDALGDKEEALRFYNLALPLSRQTGDKGGEATTLNNIGLVYDDLGDKEEALRFYNLALPLRRQTGDKGGEATTFTNIGAVYSDLGDKEEALHFYNLALPLFRQTGDKGGEATTLNNLGGVYSALGDKEEALRFYNLTLPLFRQTGDKGGEATTLNNIGLVYDDLGDKEEALRFYNLALPLRRQTGDKGGEATTLNNLGRVYDALGDKEEALHFYNLALPLSRQTGDKGGEATTLNNIGAVYSDLGDKEEALRFYNLALPLSRQTGDKGGEAATLNNLGGVYSALGDKEEALRFYNLALPLRRQTGDRWGESVTLYNRAMIYVDLGRLAEAVAELEEVVAIDEAVGDPNLASDRAMLAQVRARLAQAADKNEQE